jgi:TfoX/Sxy family transcriptional regulator of competence genes
MSLVPKDPKVTVKLMFGNDAAFANGNLFFGVYGPSLFVRLPESEAKELLGKAGAGAFEPVAGHAMTGYYTVPSGWMGKPEQVRPWVSRSLKWTLTLPPKKKK